MPPEGLPHQGKLLVAALGPDSDGDVLVLQLTGNILDETGIMGEDVGVILKKLKKCVLPSSSRSLTSGGPQSGRRFSSSNGCRTQFISSLIASWLSDTEQTHAQGGSELKEN